jgi:hypothetical protein
LATITGSIVAFLVHFLSRWVATVGIERQILWYVATALRACLCPLQDRVCGWKRTPEDHFVRNRRKWAATCEVGPTGRISGTSSARDLQLYQLSPFTYCAFKTYVVVRFTVSPAVCALDEFRQNLRVSYLPRILDDVSVHICLTDSSSSIPPRRWDFVFVRLLILSPKGKSILNRTVESFPWI